MSNFQLVHEGGAQRAGHAASSWPRTHADGHPRSRRKARQSKDKDNKDQSEGKGKIKDKPGAEVTCYLEPSQGRLQELAGGTEGEAASEEG